MCVMFVWALVGVVCGLVFVCIMVGVYGGCVWECLGRERLWRRSVFFDMLLEILSVNRFEIVLLPRGCYTTWLVIFIGTDFHETGQNSFLPLVNLGPTS